MITDGQNGLPDDFFNVDGFVQAANRVLDAPANFRHLGRAGTQLIQEDYGTFTLNCRFAACRRSLRG